MLEVHLVDANRVVPPDAPIACIRDNDPESYGGARRRAHRITAADHGRQQRTMLEVHLVDASRVVPLNVLIARV
jgi:hypothetical protein